MPKRSPYDKQREILRLMLINARKGSGITQAQLSAQLNKPQSFVSKYERGDRFIDAWEIYQICQELNHSFTDLMGCFDMAINDMPVSYDVNTNDKD